MSSILTNNGAMVALQTLQSINKNLGMTQSEISTGKSVATAKDNSAVWAISKQMESDVQGFKSIEESLALGESTTAVARNAAETVTDLLTQIKGKIVAAQEENVDRTKIQTDITALRDQIGSVVGAAQFNGLNMLGNTSRTTGEGSVNVLSSLDRSGSGVAASSISISKQDLGTTKAAYTGSTALTAGTAANLNATQTQNIVITTASVTTGQAYSIGIAGTDADASTFTPADYTTGTTSADQSKILYVAREGDTAADVARGLVAAYNGYASKQGLDLDILSVSVGDNVATGVNLKFTSTKTDGTDSLAVRVDQGATSAATATNSATIGGALASLADFDVTTKNGAKAALAGIEGLISTAIDSAAALGSAQGRIETQSSFVSKLSNSLTSGIGALVDANMEEASARLQALQVQQQLATQSLSIANQAPQSILSLFR
ncbi:flagellin [Jannaschia pohangensis]|uniref:Flagellin n=1 Tax=Jannaschia pohangensis TaxID=390807 RepID=A0A1I3R9J5_9RHOB|nr:flagellin [Jannaschia pohangensis]SFJ42835.1 flagellin [Jannaschia pohangensis]